MVHFLGALVISVGLLSECSSSNRDNKDNQKPQYEQQTPQNLAQPKDSESANGGEQISELRRYNLDNYASPQEIIGDGILIDIRNRYEREEG
jgi:hypothetical protein